MARSTLLRSRMEGRGGISPAPPPPLLVGGRAAQAFSARSRWRFIFLALSHSPGASSWQLVRPAANVISTTMKNYIHIFWLSMYDRTNDLIGTIMPLLYLSGAKNIRFKTWRQTCTGRRRREGGRAHGARKERRRSIYGGISAELNLAVVLAGDIYHHYPASSARVYQGSTAEHSIFTSSVSYLFRK